MAGLTRTAPQSKIAAPLTHAEKQWLFTPRELERTPSILAGMNTMTEVHYRAMAIDRLWKLKDAFQVGTNVIGMAAYFVHRYYMHHALQVRDYMTVSAVAFFLGSKVAESSRRLKDIVGVTIDLDNGRQPSMQAQNRVGPYDETKPDFVQMSRKVRFYEDEMLKSERFDLSIALPYWNMQKAVQIIWSTSTSDFRTKVARVSWSLINDSFVTTVCLVHRPAVIAAASIALACVQLEVPLPLSRNQIRKKDEEEVIEEGEEPEMTIFWLDLLAVEMDELLDCVDRMATAYVRAADWFVRNSAKITSRETVKALLELYPASTQLDTIEADAK